MNYRNSVNVITCVALTEILVGQAYGEFSVFPSLFAFLFSLIRDLWIYGSSDCFILTSAKLTEMVLFTFTSQN